MAQTDKMTPGDRLRAKREERGLTTAQLAARVSRSESAVRNQENGTNGIPAPLLRKYAAILGVSTAWLLEGKGADTVAAPVLGSLPIIGQIRAGAWLEVDDTSQVEPVEYPVTIDRRYPHARQWLREVTGDSMNERRIYEGDLAHMVDFGEAGIELANGMIVEVTRLRAGGALREITLKEVEITTDQILLWPRSTNPLWTRPVVLSNGDGEDFEVVITGLLLNAFRKFN